MHRKRNFLLLAILFVANAFLFQNCGGFKSLKSTAVNLSSTIGTGPTTTICNSNITPDRAPLRLLSNTEYDNIASDVFLTKNLPSQSAKLTVLTPGSTGFSNTSLTSEANAPRITDLMAEKYWTAAGLIADEAVANKAVTFSLLAPCAVNANPVVDSCYDSVVRSLSLKVWRRTLVEAGTNNEFTRLKAIAKANANFDVGFKDLIKALLISPNFIVVSYRPSSAVAAGSAFNLDNYQLASRLSLFLWQSVPDDQLMGLAKAGSLTDMNIVKAQVVRMLKDPKAKRFANVMTKEWIGANSILGLGLTTIDSATLNAMVTETQMLFEDIVASDVSFLNSISADYSFLNKALADYYGVTFSGANTAQFYKTSLASTPRRGVLNQGAFLIATAGSTTVTHPVPRGKIVSKSIACYDVSPPPVDLDTSVPSTIPANSTPAETLAIHRQRTQCAGCHAMLDPYGLPFESFDPFGKWRTTYVNLGGRSIDTSGQFPTGEKFSNTQEFMSSLASSPTNRSCMVRKVMSLGLARNVASSDEVCNSRQIAEASMNPDSKFSDLIFNIVYGRQFRTQTTEAP